MVAAILIGLFLMGGTPAPTSALEDYLKTNYSNLAPLEGSKPAYDLYERGMIGYLNLKADGNKITNEKLTLIDFRMSSKKKRMWIIDVQANKVIYHRLVAHGKNTGEEYAKKFSNTKNSNQSSLGFYVTGENYVGKHGLSLRLDGMEPDFNDNARDRAIVMHGANYVHKDFISTYGRLGRSFGCPAIAMNKHSDIVKLLANKSVLFIYYPDKEYEGKTLLNDVSKAEEYLLKKGLIISSAVQTPSDF